MHLKHVILIALIAGLSSCVPHRKYLDLETQNDDTRRELRACKTELADATSGNNNQIAALKALRKEVKDLQLDTTVHGERYRSIKQLNYEMERLCEKIRLQNEQLLSTSSSEKKEMTEALSVSQSTLNQKERDLLQKERELMELKNTLNKQELSNSQLQTELKEREKKMNELQKGLDEREGKVTGLQGDLAEREAKMGELQKDLKSRENRVLELETEMSRQKNQATALKDKLNQALLGFNASELSVEQRNGKVYVSMSQELLFKSGSKAIDAKGKQALKTLASVLNKNTDTDIIIEGHTDDVGEAASNWDLSVMRATSVVRELTMNQVDQRRITASGRGEFSPKADNATATGKAINRRTEIILSPRLDDLYRLISN